VALRAEVISREAKEVAETSLGVSQEIMGRVGEISKEIKQTAEASTKASREAMSRAEAASKEAKEVAEASARVAKEATEASTIASQGTISKAEKISKETKEAAEALAIAFAEAISKAEEISKEAKEAAETSTIASKEAISKAAEILVRSKRPLLYGWSQTVCEAHRKAIELTEVLGGVIDNTASVCHGPSILAIQRVGLPSCTLGQIKNRADLIIYWGSDQSQAHPRHMSRYTSFPKGFFVEAARTGRQVISIDVRKTTTSNAADDFIRVEPGSDYAVFSALRVILKGHPDIVPDIVGGVAKEKLIEIVEKMKRAKFGVLFFGLGLTHSRGHQYNVANAISLTAELNAYTKFVIMPMRGHFNVTGFNQLCTWETGFPFAVDFSRGSPWYNPGETTTVDILNREECDAALIVASDPVAHLPLKSVKFLAKISVIQIDPHRNLTTEIADVVIPTCIAGIEVDGTAYRMDNVPIRMRKIVGSVYPSDEEILKKILRKVRELKG